jgi:hypothetical protein
MKYILSALAAVTLLVGVAASQPAEARCFWNGWGWSCVHRGFHPGWGWNRPWGWHRPWHRWGGGWGPGWGPGWGW